MRKLLGAVGAAILGASAIIHAQSSQTVPLADNESSQLWFVELASTPAVEGTAVTALEREEAEFHASATGAGIRYTERRHFRTLWNGLTVSAAARTRAVPNGTYQIKLSILKALGDRRNPAHFERWTSPNITIARPVTTTP